MINHGEITVTTQWNLRKYKFELDRFCDHNLNKQIHMDIHPGVTSVSCQASNPRGILHSLFPLLNKLWAMPITFPNKQFWKHTNIHFSCIRHYGNANHTLITYPNNVEDTDI